MKVPHAFQDIMGTHKTPTVPFTIPMFAAFIARWKELAEEKNLWYGIIQPGLEKLEEYEQELERAPVHILAMGMQNISILS
jgi:hypothetical protein